MTHHKTEQRPSDKKELLKTLFKCKDAEFLDSDVLRDLRKDTDCTDEEVDNIIFHTLYSGFYSHLAFKMTNMYQNQITVPYSTLKNYCKISSSSQSGYNFRLMAIATVILHLHDSAILYDDETVKVIRQNYSDLQDDQEVEILAFRYLTEQALGFGFSFSEKKHLVKKKKNMLLENHVVRWVFTYPYMAEFVYDMIEDPTTWVKLSNLNVRPMTNDSGSLSLKEWVFGYKHLPQKLNLYEYIISHSTVHTYMLAHSDIDLDAVTALFFYKKRFRKRYIDEVERLVDRFVIEDNEDGDIVQIAGLNARSYVNALSKHCNRLLFSSFAAQSERNDIDHRLPSNDSPMLSAEELTPEEQQRILEIHDKLVNFCLKKSTGKYYKEIGVNAE